MGLLLLVLCAILIVLLQVTTVFEVVELRRKMMELLGRWED